MSCMGSLYFGLQQGMLNLSNVEMLDWSTRLLWCKLNVLKEENGYYQES